MSKLRLVFAAIVGVGFALALWEHSAIEKLRVENESLRVSIERLRQSQAEREPVSAVDSLSKEQLAELLKLRGEATQLRGRTNEIAGLVEQNKKLAASLKELATTNSSNRKSPPDALPEDIHPKATWAFRGYGRPEDTIESLNWAMMNGDKTAFLGALAPELRAKLEPDILTADFSERMDTVKPAGFRILDRKVVSEDLKVLTVYLERDDANGNPAGSRENITFQRIDGQWKAADSSESYPPSN